MKEILKIPVSEIPYRIFKEIRVKNLIDLQKLACLLRKPLLVSNEESIYAVISGVTMYKWVKQNKGKKDE